MVTTAGSRRNHPLPTSQLCAKPPPDRGRAPPTQPSPLIRAPRSSWRRQSLPLLVIAVIIVIIAALLCWAVDQVPPFAPFGWIIKLLIILIAVIAIADRAGLL